MIFIKTIFLTYLGDENLVDSKKSGITHTRENLYDELRNDYKNMLAIFQRTMPNASREFFKCGLEVHEGLYHVKLKRIFLS